MSHTQGRLQVIGEASITDEKDSILVNIFEDKTTPDDARRLVACWNVCRGYDTELLENIDMVGDTLKDRFEALQAELKAVPLAPDHKGMMVDYSGMLRQARENMKRNAGWHKNMLEQLQGHLEILGKRFYEGDLTVVDEFLQLYCLGQADRERVVAAQREAS